MSTDPGRELESDNQPPDLSAVQAHLFEGIHADLLARLIWVLREKHPRVIAANRRFEEETGIENKLGMNNLNDALSHIGTLVEEAPNLDRDQQAGQVTLFEDHLRRSMMESWEQHLDFQLGEIDELWEEKYKGRARRLQLAHKLPGAPSAHEIDKLRIKHKNLLQEGREAKRAGDWDGWDKGTDLLIQACATASELRTAVEDAIAAAKAYRRDWVRDKRNFVFLILGILISASVTIGVNAYNHRNDDEKPPPAKSQPDR